MSGLGQTPSQTVGPYFAYSLTPQQYGYELQELFSANLLQGEVSGTPIRIEGQVLDGAGAPISDAMVEIWQADDTGRYTHPADGRPTNAKFVGFGRCGTGTDKENRFVFQTIKPGAVGDNQAPHVNVIVFMRGMLLHAYTRIYFADEAAANAADPILQSVPPERRQTLLAKRISGSELRVYRFDIRMQGELETVFFDA